MATPATHIRVFDLRRKHRLTFMCNACADPLYRNGKCFPPVYVPVEDLAGLKCAACDAVLAPDCRQCGARRPDAGSFTCSASACQEAEAKANTERAQRRRQVAK